MTTDTRSTIVRKALFLLLGGMLFLLPIAFSLNTYQVFEVNKFFVMSIGISLLIFILSSGVLLNIPSLINRPSKTEKIVIGLFLLFLTSAGFSCIFGHAPLRSLWGSGIRHFGFFSWTLLFLLFTGILLTKPSVREQKQFIIVPILFSGAIQVLFSIIQKIDPSFLFSELQVEYFLQRSFGTMGQPNFLAQFLLFPTFLSVGLFIRESEKLKKYCYFSLIILFFIGILLTESRSGLLGVIGGAFLFLLIHIQKQIPLLQKHLGKAVFFCSITVLILFLLIPFLPTNEIPEFFQRSRSIETRLHIWNTIPEVVSDNPLLGVGFENFSTAFSPHAPKELLTLEGFTNTADRSHNIIYDLLVQTGILGFILMLSFFGFTLSQQWRNIKTPLETAYFSLIGALSITWLFGFPVLVDATFFFLFLALLPVETRKLKTIPKKSILLFTILILFSIFSISGATTIWSGERMFLRAYKTPNSEIFNSLVEKLPWDERVTFTALKHFEVSEEKEKAEEILLRYMTINPHSGDGYYYLGLHYFGEKEYEQADEAFQKSSELAPTNPSLWKSWGKMNFLRGDLEAAKKQFEMLLAISPEYWKIPHNERVSDEQYRIFFKHNLEFWEVIFLLGTIENELGNSDMSIFYCSFIPSDFSLQCN